MKVLVKYFLFVVFVSISISSYAQENTNPYTLPASYETAYSYRTNTPDQNMKNIPATVSVNRARDPDEYIRQVVEIINTNAKNDFEKVKMAHDLIALIVKYDASAYLSGRYPSQSYQSVLKNRLAVCEGYANVFKQFCDVLEIPCDIVHGFARGAGYSLLDQENPNDTNHAWNIVKIDGESYLVDVTWDAGHLSGRRYVAEYETNWLFLKPEQFLYTHYPVYAEQQLLEAPLSADQFSALPYLRPDFFEIVENISIDLPKLMHVDNSLSFEYTLKEGYKLDVNINDTKTKRELQNRHLLKTDGTKGNIDISFPAAGQYVIEINVFENGENYGEGLGEFIVEASSASTVIYPRFYSSSAENFQIISPVETSLKRGTEYTFKIRVDNKNVAALIHGRTFIQLKKGDDGLFSADFTIPNNISKLSIGVSNSTTGRYELVADYVVQR